MKYKKIMLLSCLLLVILTIGAVSAQDDAISDNGCIGVDNDLSASGDILKESSKTFTDLNNVINSNEDDNIYLEGNYTYDDGDSDFMEGIVISRNVTINGNGYTIDGNNAARIFNVEENITVVFKDIVFVNGYAEDNGGAIWGNGVDNTAVINCTFIGNSAEKSGGAVFLVETIGCTFINNAAEYNGGAAFYCIVENCYFWGNTASNGGAIYYTEVVNSIFEENYAFEGGAIYGAFECEGCNFTYNSAFSGGAIYGADDVINCIFTENSAEDCGGAIDTGNAFNCTFIGNTAERLGGAMYSYEDHKAVDCKFVYNSAQNGGATWGINATNCIFTNNSASDYGGAMYEGIANDCTFNYNSAGIDGDDYYTRNLGVEPYVEIADEMDCEDYGFFVRYYFPENATGSISIYIDGDDEPAYSSEIETDMWVRIYAEDLEGFELEPGLYDIEVVYPGDDYYGEYIWTATLEITNGTEPDENITDDYNLTFGEYHRFNQELVKGRRTYDASFEFPFSAEGYITIYVDDAYYGVEEVEYGDAFVEVDTSNLTLGKHDVRFEYSGDDYFKPSTAYDSFNVTYIEFSIPTTIKDTYGVSGVTALVAMPFDATGEVKLIVDGVEKATEQMVVDDGSVMFSLLDLPYGNHTVTLAYQNGNYPSASETANVESFIVVSQIDPILSVSADDINVGETVIINVSMNEDIDGNVLLSVNNANYTVVVSDGKGSQAISGLAAGTYDVTVTFAGDEKYLPAMNSTEFAVNKVATVISAVYDANAMEIVATLTNGATGQAIKGANVRFTVNDKKYSVKTDSSGKAKFSTATLDGGNHIVTVSYDGNSRYAPSSASIEFSTKVSTNLTLVFDNGAREVVATLVNGATGQAIKNANVRFVVNGEKYTVKSDANGQAKVSVSSLAMDTYQATASYNGNSKYSPSDVAIDFTITKIITSVSMYYDAGTNELVATLVNAETGKAISGATVVFNVNGAKTSAKTDKQGQARFTPAGVDLDNFNAGISYGGNSKYLKSTGSIKIIAGKISTCISNSYDKQAQEVTATLTNNETGQPIKGATVVFNVNGVKTSFKTDKLGQVKISVAGLDLGTNSIGSSYGGNSKYAGSTTGINIIKI